MTRTKVVHALVAGLACMPLGCIASPARSDFGLNRVELVGQARLALAVDDAFMVSSGAGIKSAQVNLRNLTGRPLTVGYRFSFFDGRGMLVAAPPVTERILEVGAAATGVIRVLAGNPQASFFEVVVSSN